MCSLACDRRGLTVRPFTISSEVYLYESIRSLFVVQPPSGPLEQRRPSARSKEVGLSSFDPLSA